MSSLSLSLFCLNISNPKNPTHDSTKQKNKQNKLMTKPWNKHNNLTGKPQGKPHEAHEPGFFQHLFPSLESLLHESPNLSFDFWSSPILLDVFSNALDEKAKLFIKSSDSPSFVSWGVSIGPWSSSALSAMPQAPSASREKTNGAVSRKT